MNGYPNIVNKNAFAIEVIACNEVWIEDGYSCASEEDIIEFASHIVIT